ncbi:hypothetical protein VKT23_014842 [Stygiomarasmius scandens]|uniref:F-box domain-containing protein n=1 Tax=Marasmiellus scandens TaxID=2682957 RepID=A0ABR1IZG4_9AGAR
MSASLPRTTSTQELEISTSKNTHISSTSLPHEVFVEILLYLFDTASTRKKGLDVIKLICRKIRSDYYIQREAYKFLSPCPEDRSVFIKTVSDTTISRHIVLLNLVRIPLDGELQELLHSGDALKSVLEVHICLSKYSKPLSNLFVRAFIPSCQILVLDFGDVDDIASKFHLCLRPLANLKRLSLSAFVHDTEDGQWSHFWDINGLILNKCMPCTLGSGDLYKCEQKAEPSPLELLIVKATFGWEFPCDLKKWIDGQFDYRFVPLFDSERLNDLLEYQELEDEWAVEDLGCFLLEEDVAAGPMHAAAEFWEHALTVSNSRKEYLDSLNT